MSHAAPELTLRGHVLHFNTQFVSHEADNAEYHEAGEEAGQTVATRYDEGVSGRRTTQYPSYCIEHHQLQF